MKNNKQIDNSLIKRKNLQKELRIKGINRTSPKALEEIENSITNYLHILLTVAKQEMMMNGRKNLKSQDIKSASRVINDNSAKEEREYSNWEI